MIYRRTPLKMEETGPLTEGTGSLICCIMCKNDTPRDFLRKHITFHHMIQEKDVVERIHKMHFPCREIEVQTTVSWVNDMIQLEESIVNIETHIEESNSFTETEPEITENSSAVIPANESKKPFNFGIMVDETQEPMETQSNTIHSDTGSEESDSQSFIDQSDLWDWDEEDLYRYRCSYCDTVGNSTMIYDHILKEHSIPGTSRTYPKYRRPIKQEMSLKIAKCKLSENMKAGQGDCWVPCDATLPEGWKYSEPDSNNVSKSYLSPDGKFLESRDEIFEYLLGRGFDLFHPSGYKNITQSFVDCDGLCEGACDNFKIRKIFFNEGDENVRRKTCKINYLDDATVCMIEDDLRKDPHGNIEDVKPVTYRPAALKGQRPWIISIKEKERNLSQSSRDSTPTLALSSSRESTSNLVLSSRESTPNQALSSRESTPSQGSSSKRKRTLAKAGKLAKRRKSSSVESQSNPRASRRSKAKTERIEHEGIYVQCCRNKCQKWRLVTEFADASLVPEYWDCSMNKDPSGRVCGVGGNNFSSDTPDIEVKFSCGSLVWGKLKGFPWWPGMIDTCPDSEEYYWVDEDICRLEPTWYHVVYFEGRGTEVTRAWIRVDDIVSMRTPITQPKGSTATRPGPLKQRLKNAIELAEAAKSYPRKVRLEKFSFSALFEKNSSKGRGKVKQPSKFIERDLKAGRVESIPRERKSVSREMKQVKHPAKRKFITGPIFSDEEEDTETEKEEPIEKEESDADLLSQILKKYSDQEDSVAEREGTSENDEEDFSIPGSDEDNEEASLEENLLSEYSSLHQTETNFDIKVEKMDTLDTPPIETHQTNGMSSTCMTEVFIKPEELVSTLNPNLDRDFAKPPLPSDVLIALAVRNLDPKDERGVSFSNIVAFLSLHFPYYNRNHEECKEMIRSAYESSEAVERENFRIKSALVPHLLARIKTFVRKNNLLIRESMLLAEFLDSMLERFESGTECEATNYRPPYSCKMLSNLAFITLCPPTSIEQVMIFLRFLFPSLDQGKTFVEKDFQEWIENDSNIQEYLSPGGKKMYLLEEGVYPEVLHHVRQFFSTKSNLARLNKSIYKPEFVNILLPNL